MHRMMFLPELTKFLKEHSYIYTVRKYRYNLEDREVLIDEVGICERQLLGQVAHEKDLNEYVDKSGFTTTKDWWRKIKALNKGYVGYYYLYEVVVVEVD